MGYEAPKAEVRDYGESEYRDATTLTQWTLWLLYAEIVILLMAIWSGYAERQMLQAFSAGLFESDVAATSAAEASDRRQGMVAIAQSVIFITGGVFILCWIHRMCHNARVKARYMQFTPGWAVGWYFIPIATWWKPFQAMKEIWEKSAEQAGARGADGAGLLGLWWTLWIVSTLLSNASFRMSLKVHDVDSLLLANGVTLASDVCSVPLCVVFISMVKQLSAMQQYAHENPLAAPAGGAYPGANW